MNRRLCCVFNSVTDNTGNISKSSSRPEFILQYHVDWRLAEEGLKGTERTMSVSASSQFIQRRTLRTLGTTHLHLHTNKLLPHWSQV